jgi:transposase
MYIEDVPNRKSPPCILLRESYRENGEVKKRTLANITRWPREIIAGLKVLLRGGMAVENPEHSFTVERSLPHGHVLAVLGMVKKVGLDLLLGRKASEERNLVVAMLVARILNPLSKLATVRGLREETAFNSLAEECHLEVERVDENALYRAMDWLLSRQRAIEKKLAERYLHDGTFVLYDLTSTYFEGKCCPLAKLGHNRDGKKGKLQIELGLLCNLEGLPVAVEVFAGNTGDPATVSSQIEKLRKRFGFERLIMVGDRGMLTEARIREEFQKVPGLDWITALRGPAIRKLVADDYLQLSLFDERDLAVITSPDYPGERLIVCRNPQLAEERAVKREELLTATERELAAVVKATTRSRRPLRGKSAIGIKVGQVLNHYKVGKHFRLTITSDGLHYERRQEKIRAEASLDGFYVIRTSLGENRLATAATVKTYKRLTAVEQAFRSLKSIDLKVRPIFHYLADRVRAHVLLCMLAYHVEWHLRRALAPILFDDEDKEAAEQQRSSVVAPAIPSPSARQKAAAKKNQDGYPVHSFQTLLKDLATMVKDRMRPNLPTAPCFYKITQATLLQKKAFALLGIKI